MKSIQAKPFKNDDRSLYIYLGSAKAKDVSLQHTEHPDANILDITFETALDEERNAKFLIRLETTMSAIRELKMKIAESIDQPKPHPWDEDPFDKAVTGKTGKERIEESILKHEGHS